MELMFKWDPKRKAYDPYQKPWYSGCRTVAGLDDEVLCAGCGKRIVYGDTYVSRLIHDRAGFGYAVCEKCYKKEFEELREDK